MGCPSTKLDNIFIFPTYMQRIPPPKLRKLTVSDDLPSPKVTVIMPYYNNERTIARSIGSVLSQSYTNFELILVDHGSEDDSKHIAESFRISDKRIVIQVLPHNTGRPAVARNTGIRLSTGSIVAFVDADDTWFPTKLSYAVREHQNGAVLVYHSLRKYSLDKRMVLRGWRKGRIRPRRVIAPVWLDLVVGGNTIPLSSVTILKSLVEDVGLFDEGPESQFVEDYDYWIRIGKTSNQFVLIERCLGTYGVGQGQSSGTSSQGRTRQASIQKRHDLSNFATRTKISYLIRRPLIAAKLFAWMLLDAIK